MGTWTRIYIKNNFDDVDLKLKEITEIREVSHGKFPEDFHNSYLMDEKAYPNYLVYGEQCTGWITVIHNSLSNLNDWTERISKELNCTLVVTIGQTTVDYYYYCHYNLGIKIREVLVCYGDIITPINFGEPYPFEDNQPGKKVNYTGEDEYIFDFDTMEKYCQYLGFEPQSENWEEVNWTILKEKGKHKQASIKDSQKKLAVENKNPWWKFWE